MRTPLPGPVACLVAAVLAIATAAADGPFAGRSLADALTHLRARGLRVVYSSETVTPAMVVDREPTATGGRALLEQLLAPFGLEVRTGPAGTLIVVRGVREERGEASDGPRREIVLRETVHVTPSRTALLGDEPVGGIGFGSDEIAALPHLGDDFFRAVTLAPGVTSSDTSARFSVRGARTDETQILLDGQELYGAFHLQDFDSALSLVPATTLGSVELTTGGFPVEFGDRMAGVLDMRTVTPAVEASGHVGVSAFHLSAGGEGGYGDDRGRWLVQARRGTIDLVDDLLGDEHPRYGDAYVKIEHWLGPGQAITLHGLYAADRFTFEEVLPDESKRTDTRYDSGYVWLTHRATIGGRGFVESSVSRSRLERERTGAERDAGVDFTVRDARTTDVVDLRHSWTWQVAPRHRLKWGAELRAFDTTYDYDANFAFEDPLADIRPGPTAGSTRFADRYDEDHTNVWIADRMTPSDDLVLEFGVRFDRHTLTDETEFSPRFNLAWTTPRNAVVRVAWGRFLQSQRPYELGVEDGQSAFATVERAEHRLLGYEANLGRAENAPRWRVEYYERRVGNPRERFENLFEALNTFPELEPDRVRIAPQRSRARGVELFLRGAAGERWTWFVNVALAESEDTIDGEDVPRAIDQRHAVNADLDWRIGERWSLNLAWRYHDGWPTTPLTLSPEDDGSGGTVWVPVLGRLRSDRLPDYHRLDARLRREVTTRRGRLALFVDVQNLYDRANVAGFDIEIDEDAGTLERETETWAGILPSIGLNYRF